MDLGLSTLSSGAFLMLYVALLAAACAASFAISIRLRPEGQAGVHADMEDLAILSGGKKRLVEAVAAKLNGNGSIEVMSNGEFTVLKRNKGDSSAERAVLRLDSPFKWAGLAEAVRTDSEVFEEDLVRKGWLLDGGDAARLRFLQAVPFLILLAFGFIRSVAGSAESEPIGGLTFFLFVTAAAAILRLYFFDRRTLAGQHLFALNSDKFSRLKRAPEADELGYAVALYGTGVLAGTSFATLHAAKAQNSAGGGGCSPGGDNSGNDGSGCGGGCGGCGG